MGSPLRAASCCICYSRKTAAEAGCMASGLPIRQSISQSSVRQSGTLDRWVLLCSSHGATIIADDCTKRFPAVQAAWRTIVLGGTIAQPFNRTMSLPPPGGLKGWCVGRYAPGGGGGGGGGGRHRASLSAAKTVE